jgi:hypothetical protein
MDHKKARKAQDKAQDSIRRLVVREVTPVIQAQHGPINPAQEAFIRAIYAPDKRLG